MKTIYTIESHTNSGYGPDLTYAAANSNIPIVQIMLFPDELKKIGVFIEPRHFVGYRFDYNPSSEEKELEAISFLSKECDISFSKLTAVIDYDIFTPVVLSGLKPLLESVQLKKVSDSDVYSDFEEQFRRIDCDSKTLIITDPYLFKVDGATQNMLINILNKSKASNIIFYYVAEGNRIDIESTLKANGINVTSIKTSDFHDRLWLCKETNKGFISGTSFNGIGNKISVIVPLPYNDVTTLLASLPS